MNGSNKRFSAAEFDDDGKHHILLAATGSVATIKIPLIAEALSSRHNVSVRILLTPSAEQFLIGQSEEQPDLNALQKITQHRRHLSRRRRMVETLGKGRQDSPYRAETVGSCLTDRSTVRQQPGQDGQWHQ